MIAATAGAQKMIEQVTTGETPDNDRIADQAREHHGVASIESFLSHHCFEVRNRAADGE